MFKKLINSKLLRFSVSAVLIYFAFKKVDMVSIFRQLLKVDFWFLLENLLLSWFLVVMISYRWSLLLIEKPTWKDIFVFAKSNFAASFYGLVIPTAVAGDLLKWIIVDEKYPKIPKTKILGSVFLDRFIGMSVFVFFGMIMLIVGQKFGGPNIPTLIIVGFLGLSLACLTFYILVAWGKIDNFFKIKYFSKLKNISDLLMKENFGQIAKAMSISLLSGFLGIFQTWFIANYFGSNVSLSSIFIFIPVISMILSLPISIAGFGAREQLFLLFFSAPNTSTEGILLTAAFIGIMGILNSLFGGLVTLTPDFKKNIEK